MAVSAALAQKACWFSSVWWVCCGRCRVHVLLPRILDPREELLGMEHSGKRVHIANHVMVGRLLRFLEGSHRLAEGELDVGHRHVVLSAEVQQIRPRQESSGVDLGDAHGPLAVLLEINAGRFLAGTNLLDLSGK